MHLLIIENPRHGGITVKHQQALKQIGPNIKLSVADESDSKFESLFAAADVMIVPPMKKLDFTKAANLKWLHLTSAGANMLSKEIINSEVIVTNSSGVHPIPISEHVMGLMLMLVRDMHKAYKNQLEKKTWIRDGYQAEELAGKNLLVVGMGRIGERVAKLGLAFEMTVTGVVRDKSKHKSLPGVTIVEQNQLNKELKKSDVIVNCLPATLDTFHLFDKKRIAYFKKGSIYISIGRGDTTDEKELIAALKSGQIRSAGLDVFEKEPLPDSSPLWKMDNVVITPHYSGHNPHYTDRMIEIFCENLKAYLKKKPMPNLVDKKLGY